MVYFCHIDESDRPYPRSGQVPGFFCIFVKSIHVMPQTALQPLFESYTGQQLGQVQELPSSGSNRRYFRLSGGNVTLIGVIGTSKEENRAFIALSRHFREKGLHVPAVLAVSEDSLAYIQEDLGDQVLFDLVSQGRESGI